MALMSQITQTNKKTSNHTSLTPAVEKGEDMFPWGLVNVPQCRSGRGLGSLPSVSLGSGACPPCVLGSCWAACPGPRAGRRRYSLCGAPHSASQSSSSVENGFWQVSSEPSFQQSRLLSHSYHHAVSGSFLTNSRREITTFVYFPEKFTFSLRPYRRNFKHSLKDAKMSWE